MNGSTVQPVSRWQPTSRMGSECGCRIAQMPLAKRQWLCPHCWTENHRDLKSAQTTLAAALEERSNTWGTGESLGLAHIRP